MSTEKLEGLTLALDLDYSKIDDGMKSLKRQLGTVNSEMNANLSAFNKGEESVARYTAIIDGLNKKLDLQKGILKSAEKELAQLKRTQDEQNASLDKAAERVDKARKQYEKLSQAENATQKELEKAKKEVLDAEKAFEKLGNNIIQTEKKMDKAQQTVNKEVVNLNKLEKSLENNTKSLEKFNKEQENASKWNIKLAENLEKQSKKLEKTAEGFKNWGEGISKGITVPITGLGIAANRSFYEVDEGLDTVTMATGATGKALEDLQESFKKVYGSFPEDAEIVGGVLGEVNTRLGFTGKKLEKATESFLKFSQITGSDAVSAVQLATRAMGDASIEADDYGTILDSVAKAAQASGIGVEKLLESLTKYGAPMRALGFEVKDSIALFSQWEKAGVNTEVAFSGMKKAISEWGKANKDPAKEFKKTLEEIKKAPNIAAATSKAIEAFGAKAGPDLADAIQNGRFSIEEMNKVLKDSKGTVNQTFEDTLDGAEDFKIGMNNVKLGLSDLWGSVESAISPYLVGLGDHIRNAAKWFGSLDDKTKRLIVVFGGVAAAIGPVIWAIGSFVGSLGKISGFLEPLMKNLGKGGGLGSVLGALTSPIGLITIAIIGIGTALVVLYNKSDKFRKIVNESFEKVKKGIEEFVNFVKPTVKEVVDAVVSFAKELGKMLKDFWKENGNTIIDALKNIAKIIGNVLKVIFAVFKFIFPAIKAIVSSVWGNIKGVIKGALNIIMGVIKIFAGLFTGNFKKMWEGVKQLFFGAIQFVWNYVQLMFIGKLLKGIGGFIKLFAGGIKSMWTKIIGFFKSSGKSIYDGIVGRFKAIYTSVNKIISSMVKWVIDRIRYFVRDSINFFKNLYKSITNIIDTLKTWLSDAWNFIKDKAVDTIVNMKDRVVGTFEKLWNSAKGFIQKIKDGFVGMKDKVVETAKALADGLKKHAIGGINKMIDGINWVGDKLGMGKEIIKPIKLSTGTVDTDNNGRLTKRTMAIVNDKGPGNGPGGYQQELLQSPSGELYAPQGENVPVILDKGWGVINGHDTYHLAQAGQIPMLSGGTDIFSKATGIVDSVKDTVSDVYDAVTSKIGDVIDYIDNPAKLVDKIIDAFGVNFKGITQVPGQLIGAMFKKIKDGAINLFKKWFEESGGGDGSSFTKFGKITPYSPNAPVPGYPTSFNGGRHYGIDYATPYGTVINAPTSGTVTEQYNFGGGIVARLVNGLFAQYFLHLSKVLKHGHVEQGEAFAVTGNSGHWTTGAHLHYQVESPPSASISNANTIDPEKFLSGHAGRGGSRGASGWRSEVIRALGIAGLPRTQSYINAWINQIQSESGGNPNIVQSVKDVNSGWNDARGLVQVTPQTFASMHAPGMGNIYNPVHNLVAGMNWAKYAYGGNMLNYIGRGHGYEYGGYIDRHQWIEVGERNNPEMVIPLTKPSRALKLIREAQTIIGDNNRPNQIITTSDNRNVENLMKKNNQLLEVLIRVLNDKEFNIHGSIEKVISREQAERYELMRFMGGS